LLVISTDSGNIELYCFQFHIRWRWNVSSTSNKEKDDLPKRCNGAWR